MLNSISTEHAFNISFYTTHAKKKKRSCFHAVLFKLYQRYINMNLQFIYLMIIMTWRYVSNAMHNGQTHWSLIFFSQYITKDDSQCLPSFLICFLSVSFGFHSRSNSFVCFDGFTVLFKLITEILWNQTDGLVAVCCFARMYCSFHRTWEMLEKKKASNISRGTCNGNKANERADMDLTALVCTILKC